LFFTTRETGYAAGFIDLPGKSLRHILAIAGIADREALEADPVRFHYYLEAFAAASVSAEA
jgi:hypothetical protein